MALSLFSLVLAAWFSNQWQWQLGFGQWGGSQSWGICRKCRMSGPVAGGGPDTFSEAQRLYTVGQT